MAKRAGRHEAKTKQPDAAKSGQVSSKPASYEVLMTASAEKVYLELKQLSEDAELKHGTVHSHCTTFRMVHEAITRLIPSDPTNKRYGMSAPLSDMFRIRKGRMRICWMVSSQHRQVMIVFISTTPRKEGDVNDPYRVLERMIKAGYLSDILSEWKQLTYVPSNAPVH